MNFETAAEETPCLSFYILELFISDIGVEYASMYNGKRFYVTISVEKLGGKRTLLDDFNNIKNDIDDPYTIF